jgi:Icc-related predicted phosphoesterase
MPEQNDRVRIAALADLHVHEGHSGEHRDLLTDISRRADILLLCGDLTNRGTPQEAESLLEELAPCRTMPILAILGNHDFESGQQDEVRRVLCAGGVKLFVRETIDEALQLESELGKLRTEFRIAVLHYAPVRDTVEGEPPEIFPFLGASRLAEPVDRFEVTAVFHGHAHHGSPEGRTTGGVPVYNVSLPLMRRVNPERPYYLLEL